MLLKGPHQPVLRATLALADVAYGVLLETAIDIAPLPIWMDQWTYPEIHSNPALLANIAREGIRVWQ